MSIETSEIDILLQEEDGILNIKMKCKCCEFALVHEIEEDDVKMYLFDVIEKMSAIFDKKKRD